MAVDSGAVAETAIAPVVRPAEGVRKWLAFGAGVGVEIRGADLHITAVRVRPSGVTVLGSTVVPGVLERPASEWGAEFTAFTRSVRAQRIPITVLLPRRDVFARTLALPGVETADLASAISYQIDSLHPFADSGVEWTWSRLGNSSSVLVAIAQRELVDAWANRFSEAGIKMAGFTFSAAALWSASRILVTPPAGYLALGRTADGAIEAYGEGPAFPLFSTVFEDQPERARLLALSQLRLDPDVPSLGLADALPPVSAPETFDRHEEALSLAAAISGACPRLSLGANLLPADRRTQSSRALYIPTAILGALVIAAATAVSFQQTWHDRAYAGRLQQEVTRLEREARHGMTMDAQSRAIQDKISQLDRHRARARADADALRELTTIVAPPGWVTSLQMSRTDAFVSGETEQAVGLLKAIDSSPLFKDSAFSQAMTKVGGGDQFSLRTFREGPGTGLETGETR